MWTHLDNYQIILASNSPRRKELLGGLGLSYEVKTLPNIDESFPEGLPGEEIPIYISREKAEAYRSLMKKNELIITADTIVWLEGQVLGKPKDAADARRMLHLLSGRTHQVITGVCITTLTAQCSFSTSTDVTFANLSDDEIDYYVDHYKPMDKAGAYGIQEWIGFVGVEHIDGSYFNVMGLPVQRLYKELKAFKG